ncbi:MAG: hypothetical protein A3J55_03480 [Candidatus Ryanbacteria bacterium RIFCSPHIGHO2_02_FULL_45_17b]|uniref:Uncharacterized protein n=1 Tax=Candidatus Ryanbacteria bacterium RIFCSPHIGHO2_01_FULL_45_22 TaxID=1802114 RepID=A0A1G2G2X2_9BACT|nr:MAG: hypothetical protein A2719_04685 [Candidatus Ryanbacteria bacterium RIFCSPHIGHO2_01_FULL_45_22]OGZ47522.1 MAG: hypothetical protein A3J55_03480 [Candidatus Ryanbacteria bacterium RIFCSPHIGHO2_02_FULL_45_17b]
MKIVGYFGAVIGIILIVFFMFFRREDVPVSDVSRDDLSLPQNREQNKLKIGEFSETGGRYSSQVGFKELFVPVVRPLEPAISYVEGVFLEKKNENEHEKTYSAFTPEFSFSAGKREWTDVELFEWTWGKEYRQHMLQIQDIMISDGFLREDQRNISLSSDEDVYEILGMVFEYAAARGWISRKDAEILHIGLKELPKNIAMERAALQAGTVTPQVLPGHQSFNMTRMDKYAFMKDIIDGIKYVFSAQDASAQIPGGGNWVTSPDCYKDLAPNPLPGVSLWAFCCNCGLFCTPTGCTFVSDCGPFSPPSTCNVPLGCLNGPAVVGGCGGWPNAIWDKFSNPLGTGICGCG